MNADRITAAITSVANALEQLGINYYIGGSVASSAYGVPRATLDVDVIADIRQEHVRPLIKLLEAEYYVDEDMIRDAIKTQGSFNIIYLNLMVKVDVFLPKARSFDQEELRRVRRETVTEAGPLFQVASPEDIVLHKLEWYRMGNEISDRQWNDIIGVLKVRGAKLDRAYLRHWAANLGVTDLLDRALVEAGLPRQ